MSSLVDRVSSALVFCLFLNKNAMLSGVRLRSGEGGPEVGERGGLWAPNSCYLDGRNMQTVMGLLCPQGDDVVPAVGRDVYAVWLSRCYDGAESSQRPNAAAAALPSRYVGGETQG